MGLLDYADEYGKRFRGLLGKMPGVTLLKAGQGEASLPSMNDLRGGLLSIKPFDSKNATQGAYEAGLNFLGTFAGVGAKTANKELLEVAQKLDKAGVDRAKIWNETGWFKGPEGKWRFEIDDSGSIPGHKTYSWGEKADIEAGNATTVRRQKALLHPDLSAAYPDTKNIGFVIRPNADGGAYHAEMDSIFAPYAKNGAVDKSIALHELQHAIQQREGFAAGGSPDIMHNVIESRAKKLDKEINDFIVNNRDANFNFAPEAKAQLEALNNQRKALGTYRYSPFDAYKALAGEAEARAVQARMDFDLKKRKQIPPWESYDIPWDQLIVR